MKTINLHFDQSANCVTLSNETETVAVQLDEGSKVVGALNYADIMAKIWQVLPIVVKLLFSVISSGVLPTDFTAKLLAILALLGIENPQPMLAEAVQAHVEANPE